MILGQDLNLGQNSKNKIQIFLDFAFLIFCPSFKSLPRSSFSINFDIKSKEGSKTTTNTKRSHGFRKMVSATGYF